MISIERFGRARGLRIRLWKGRQVEVWFCPKGTVVPEHVHERVDSTIIYLAGTMKVSVEGKSRTVFGPLRKRESNGRWVPAWRYIPAGQRHSAEVLGGFALFLNFERCHGNRESASKDFILSE